MQGHLAADEAERLGGIRPRAGGVELQFVADRPAEQRMDGFAPHLGQQVPQGEVDAGDRVQHHALAAVELGGEVHLVPHRLDVGDRPPLDEPGEVLLDDESTDLPARRDGETHRAVIGFDLDHQRAEDVDAERLAARPVRGIARHRRGDVVVDPVAVALVMVVGAAPALHREGPHGLDDRHGHGGLLVGR